ncbi:MAG TPA: hypothetical protein GX731_09190, partial [Clostridiales bacterium]|nr:hypothetical protein [Clostridiales bacterium]
MKLKQNKEIIKVAVIDNGLNKSLYYKLTGKKIKTYRIRQGECLSDEDGWEHYDANHGTVCAALLTEFTDEADIISISVNESGGLPLDNLGVALFWCIDHHIDLICISLGTSSWIELRELFPIFKLLEESKIIVVGAGSNDGRITFPASLPSVLGVRFKKGSSGLSETEIVMIDDPIDGIDIETDMPPSKVLKQLQKRFQYEYPMANSMVAPYIAARIIELMNQGYLCRTVDELKKNIKKYICTAIKEEKEELAYSWAEEFSYISKEECIHWLENLTQPVIVIVYQEEKGNKGAIGQLVLGLQQLFYKNGFEATIFSTVLASNMKKSVFWLDDSRLEESFLNYTKIVTSDLFLLHLPISALISHNRRSFMDLIIEYKQENKLSEIVKREKDNWMILPADSKSVEEQIGLI